MSSLHPTFSFSQHAHDKTGTSRYEQEASVVVDRSSLSAGPHPVMQAMHSLVKKSSRKGRQESKGAKQKFFLAFFASLASFA
jgi:hypothetical protein